MKEVEKNSKMKNVSFWTGKTLRAIDECVMYEGKHPTLTIGNRYKPILKELSDDMFTIIDDDGEEHYFCYSNYTDFFKVVKLVYKNKSK